MKVCVRKGTAADVKEVAALWQSLVGTVGYMWDEEYPGETDAMRDVEEGALYVLCEDGEDGEIIGAMSAGDDDALWSLGFWSLDIKRHCGCSRLGIAAKYQGRGLAKYLFSHVEKDVLQRGYDGIGFLVSPHNPAALAVYDKMGYMKIGETWMYEQDFYCYEKNLVRRDWSSIRLHTDRLVLRPQSILDMEDSFVYCSDPENTRYMLGMPDHTREENLDFLMRAEAEWKKEEPRYFEFSMVLDGHVIGGLDVCREEEADTFSMGWIVNKNYWGQGYGTEAALAVKDFAVKALGARKLIARCDSRNEASICVMKKLGMKKAPGTHERHYEKTGERAEGLTYVVELQDGTSRKKS